MSFLVVGGSFCVVGGPGASCESGGTSEDGLCHFLDGQPSL